MIYQVIFIEDFHAHWDYDTMIQVYAITGAADKPIMVYMCESCGYYNCYDSLEMMLKREWAGDYNIPILLSIETAIVDVEANDDRLHTIMVDTFINKTPEFQSEF